MEIKVVDRYFKVTDESKKLIGELVLYTDGTPMWSSRMGTLLDVNPGAQHPFLIRESSGSRDCFKAIATFEEIPDEATIKPESLIYNRSNEKVKCPLCDEMIDGESAEYHAASHRVHSQIVAHIDKLKIDSIFGEGTYEKNKSKKESFTYGLSAVETPCTTQAVIASEAEGTDKPRETSYVFSGEAPTYMSTSMVGSLGQKQTVYTLEEKLNVMLNLSGSKTKEDLIRWIVCDGEPADESCIGHKVMHKYQHATFYNEWDECILVDNQMFESIDRYQVKLNDGSFTSTEYAKKIAGYDYSPKPEAEKKLKPVDENCLYKPVLTIGSDKEDRGQILVGIYDDAMCIFKKDYLKLEIMADKDKVYRIDDYDYGGGGNYD